MIEVDLRPGREPERKKGLVDGIAGGLNETMGIKAEDIAYSEKHLHPTTILGESLCQNGCQQTSSDY